AAFDQIYARRKALGNSPYLVKSILGVWNNLDLGGLDEREVLRDFLKRLLRLAPFVRFEALGTDALERELSEVAREAIDAMRSLTSSTPRSPDAELSLFISGSLGETPRQTLPRSARTKIRKHSAGRQVDLSTNLFCAR